MYHYGPHRRAYHCLSTGHTDDGAPANLFSIGAAFLQLPLMYAQLVSACSADGHVPRSFYHLGSSDGAYYRSAPPFACPNRIFATYTFSADAA